MTGKNPMDLVRKLHKYQQWVKISRRGLQVRIDQPISELPDFALGTYQVKHNSDYTLLINVEVPKQAEYLRVNFYGLHSHSIHPNLINQARIIPTQHRDMRFKFHTYPKTRYIFVTIQAIFPHDPPSPKTVNYQINYLFIESKTPIPRGIETPEIPKNFDPEYNIECSPRVINEIDLPNLLQDFQSLLPINLDLFEHSLMNYLLQKELDPTYLESLLNNIKISKNIKSDRPRSQFRQIGLQELRELQNDIKKGSSKLEHYLLKVDKLTNDKTTLEVHLYQDKTQETQNFEHQDLVLNLKTHREIEKALNLKFHHIKSLEHSHKSYISQTSGSTSIQELITYYQSRILKDLTIVKQNINLLEAQEVQMRSTIIDPINKSNSEVQGELDQTLLNYRKARKTCLVIKAHLDEKISKFVTLFYHYLHQKNYSIYDN